MFGLNKSKLTSTNRTSQYIWHIPKKCDTWNLKHPQINMVGWLSFGWRTKSWLTWTNGWLSPFPSIQKKLASGHQVKMKLYSTMGLKGSTNFTIKNHHPKGWMGIFFGTTILPGFSFRIYKYHFFWCCCLWVKRDNTCLKNCNSNFLLVMNMSHILCMFGWFVDTFPLKKNSFSIITPWPFLQPLTPWPILWLC